MKSKSKNNILKIDKTKKFKIVSDFEPSGDQPSAIETIVKNIICKLMKYYFLKIILKIIMKKMQEYYKLY